VVVSGSRRASLLSHGVNCGWECAAHGISGRENYFEKLPPREGTTKQFWSYFKKPVFRNYYGVLRTRRSGRSRSRATTSG
jgi:hypothetical protein